MKEKSFEKKISHIIDILFIAYLVMVFTMNSNATLNNLIAINAAVISVLIFYKMFLVGKVYYNRSIILLFIVSAFALISMIWAKNISFTIAKGVSLLINVIFMTLLYNNYHDEDRMNFMVKSFIFAGVVLCVLEISNQGLSGYFSMLFGGKRVYSEILNVNEIGIILAFGSLFTFNEILKKNYKYIPILVLFIIEILSASSKTSMIILTVGLLYLFFMKRKDENKKMPVKKRLIVLFVTVISIVLLIQLPVFSSITSRVSKLYETVMGTGNDMSTSERIALYKKGIEVFTEHPIIGIGFASSYVVTEPVIGKGVYFHSDLIEFLGCLGLIGAGIYYASLFLIATNNNKNRISGAIMCMILVGSITSCTYLQKFKFVLLVIAMLPMRYEYIIINDKVRNYFFKIVDMLKNPKIILYRIIRLNPINKRVSDKVFIKIEYEAKMNKKLNLDNPQTYNEKVQWLKLNDRKDYYTKMVDKANAKDYVKKIIGEKYIIPTIGVYDSFDKINFDKLPNEFVMKCTHNSGHVFIVKNKNKLDFDKIRKTIESDLKKNYYWVGREYPYKNIKPKIIIEKYIHDKNYSAIRDYKFLTFNGKTKYIYVSDNSHTKDQKIAFFDEKYHFLNIERDDYGKYNSIPSKPKNFELMKSLAEKLSKDTYHLRVDFYEIDGNVYFGEITFYTGGGFVPFKDEKWDYELGKEIKLPINKE